MLVVDRGESAGDDVISAPADPWQAGQPRVVSTEASPATSRRGKRAKAAFRSLSSSLLPALGLGLARWSQNVRGHRLFDWSGV